MDRGWGDATTQLLALPVLLLAVLVLWRTRGARDLLALLSLAALGPIVIAAQLVFDITSTPWETERALYACLPPTAAFLGCAALPASVQRQGLGLLIALVAFSLLLAILQLTAPQDSIFNPFPHLQPVFGGLFANQNHHATALGIAALVLLTWSSQASSRRDAGSAAPAAGRVGLAVLFLVAIAFTGSRGMALIAAVMLLALPLANGWMGRQIRREGGTRRVLIAILAQMMGFALVFASTMGWMRVDHLEEGRGLLRDATASLAIDAMPFGSGVGSFVSWFEAHLPDDLLQLYYYNHAHNEYVQWWLEAGLMGLAWSLVLILGFLWTRPRRAPRAMRPDGAWTGSWLGIGCVLAHSFFDYPLRTPALATVLAWLAAVAVTRTIDYRRHSRTSVAHMGRPPT